MNAPNSIHGGFSGLVSSPKTILGFFVALIGLLGLSIFGLAKVFAEVEALRRYIPSLLLFGAGAFVFVAVSILITAWINPEKLMLGEVKGEIYLQMLRLRQGDNVAGDVIEQIPISVSAPSSAMKQLAPPEARKEDDENV
jgi:hypothetical protein